MCWQYAWKLGMKLKTRCRVSRFFLYRLPSAKTKNRSNVNNEWSNNMQIRCNFATQQAEISCCSQQRMKVKIRNCGKKITLQRNTTKIQVRFQVTTNKKVLCWNRYHIKWSMEESFWTLSELEINTPNLRKLSAVLMCLPEVMLLWKEFFPRWTLYGLMKKTDFLWKLSSPYSW